MTTPSGVQSGSVPITFILTADEATTTDVAISYSTDGSVFRAATAAGSEVTDDLAAEPGGTQHVFVWDTNADLDGERESTVLVRVTPDDGVAGVSGTFVVHNGRFLLAVEDREDARVRLYRADVAGGDLAFLGNFEPGGRDPYDVDFVDGYFFVVNRTSNDVSVLQLDEEEARVITVEDSPFATDGLGSTFLAADGDYVFVSNTTSGTISMFEFEASTGRLELTTNSGIAAPGCQDLAVRSNRLFVANQAAGEILIYDIVGDELLNNSASPITGGGLTSPRALRVVGTRVYAANVSTADICGFNVQGDGSLNPVTGSPFAVSTAGIEDLGGVGAKVVATTGGNNSLLSLTVDAFGVVTEDSNSPLALLGSSFGVVAGGSVVVAVSSSGEALESWTIDASDTLVVADSSPLVVGLPLLRVALSD